MTVVFMNLIADEDYETERILKDIRKEEKGRKRKKTQKL